MEPKKVYPAGVDRDAPNVKGSEMGANRQGERRYKWIGDSGAKRYSGEQIEGGKAASTGKGGGGRRGGGLSRWTGDPRLEEKGENRV